MITSLILGFSVACIVLFLCGFYTGLYIARHSREVITVEKVVEKPAVIPMSTTQPLPKQPASLPVMGKTRHIIADPTEREQMEHITTLFNNTPEA